MGRPSYGGNSSGGGGDRDRRPRREYSRSYNRRKVCQFCVDKVSYIDYKDIYRLRRFLSDRARIEPRRTTGTCAKHQRRLSTAIKRARVLALLPYTPEQLRTLGFARPEGGYRGRQDGGGYRGGGGRYQRSDGGSGYRPSSRPPYGSSTEGSGGSPPPSAAPQEAPTSVEPTPE